MMEHEQGERAKFLNFLGKGAGTSAEDEGIKCVLKKIYKLFYLQDLCLYQRHLLQDHVARPITAPYRLISSRTYPFRLVYIHSLSYVSSSFRMSSQQAPPAVAYTLTKYLSMLLTM